MWHADARHHHAPPHEIAEQIVEYIRKGRGKVALPRVPATSATHATLEGTMPVPVISGTFVRVFQYFVGLVHFFELGLGFGFFGVPVRVKFFGFLAISFFDFFSRRSSADTQYNIIIAL